jgi:hypothetical protein
MFKNDSYCMVEKHDYDIGELGCVVTVYGSGWIVRDKRECDCRLQRI